MASIPKQPSWNNLCFSCLQLISVVVAIDSRPNGYYIVFIEI
jgi:hypothetical protein